MKRLVVTLLVTFCYNTLLALPLANPAAASLYTDSLWSDVGCSDYCSPDFCWANSWNVRLGFYGDYVFDRHMAVDIKGEPNIEKMEIYTNAGYLVVNICERVDLFSTLGVTNMSIQTPLASFVSSPLSSTLLSFSFEPGFSWSLGGRAILWQWKCFLLGVEGQYFRTNTEFSSLLEVANQFTYIDGQDIVYDEWQVGLGLSYKFSSRCPRFAWVPYIGVTWAESKLHLNGLQTAIGTEIVTFEDLESDKLWGYAVGVTFTLAEQIGITVEGHFANEKAVYVGGEFRF
jgi:major outer membrane protein